MKQMKKFLSVFLSFVMLLSITIGIDLSAYAAKSGDFEYFIDEGIITITGYSGTETDLIIPSFIGSKKVESIGKEAFFENSNIENITISKGIKYSGESAFDGSTIENIIIPDTVKEISHYAFYACNMLESIDIPSSVTYLGRGCFSSSISLEEVKLHNGIVTLDCSCFANCISLKSITIPGSVKPTRTANNNYQSSNIFQGCKSLKTVVIQKGAIQISSSDFADCTALEDIYIPKTITNIRASGGDIGDAFRGDTALKNVYYYGTKTQWENIGYHGMLDNAEFHYLVEDKAIPGTCTTAGKSNGFHCSDCGKIVKKQVTTSIDSSNHSYTVINTATLKNDGIFICKRCNFKKSIPKINSASLVSTSYTYDGKIKKPSVTVKDAKNKKIDSKYYTVKYSNNKNVGTATATITFKGNYSGTLKKTFKINPKSTSITKLIAGKKKFTVKWKEQSTQTTGYQIQYSTSSKFTNAKTVTISKNSTTSKTISKLSAKKKYYVRIRTYITAKENGKPTKIYSSWSKSKAVTTKK